MPKHRISIEQDGPIMDLPVSMDRTTAHALVAAGRSVPSARTVRALIDTGSDITAIHPVVLQLFSQDADDRVEVRRPGMDRGSFTAPLHDVRVSFAGSRRGAKWLEVTAVGLVPASPGVLAIIGRDLLAHCRFLYDGPKAEILLSY